ncbi:MAG: cupin domain-containing protein [Hyphomicrobiaceae bacterium]
MIRLNDRNADSAQFRRRKATEDTKRKLAHWEVWVCKEREFSHFYDRTVSLYVHEGAARLTFEDGKKVDIEPGDCLSLEQGARAQWSVSPPIRNSYMYHDTFDSAAMRSAQFYRKDGSGWE